MGWSGGRERGFWKVWLADVNGKVEKSHITKHVSTSA